MTPEEAKVILSKNLYWEEIAKRDEDHTIQARAELSVIVQDLGIFRVLAIITAQAKQVKQFNMQRVNQ